MPGVKTIALVTDEHLGNVLAEFMEVQRVQTLNAVCEAGRVLLDGCYGGSVEAWRSKSGKKRDSLRRLAARPECMVSHTTLHKYIGVSVACLEMPFVFKRDQLNTSHVEAVLGLEHHERVAFLERAHADKWSARALKQMVIEHRRDQGERRGAPAAPPHRMAKTRLARCERTLKETVELLTSPGSEPPPKAVETLSGDLDRIQSLIDRGRRYLEQHRAPDSPKPAFGKHNRDAADEATGVGVSRLRPPDGARVAEPARQVSPSRRTG